MSKVSPQRTPSRKSPRTKPSPICLDSTPVQPSRTIFEVNTSTPSSRTIRFVARGKVNRKVVYEGKSLNIPHDSDFEDEVPLLKRFRINKDAKSPGPKFKEKKVTIPRKPNQKVAKNRKTATSSKESSYRWLCYTNFVVVGEIKQRLDKVNLFYLFKESLFGYLVDLPHLKCQSQLIRALILNVVKSDRPDTFSINLNGMIVHFGLAEFKCVTGFKCGPLDDFVHDLDCSSTLIGTYFPKCRDSFVRKKDFINVFKDEALIKPEHLFDMCIVYFISTFILSSPPSKSVIPKEHFLLVESGKYTTYPWGHLSFFEFRDSVTLPKVKNAPYVRLYGFPVALQIWFYECCNQVDSAIAVRAFTRSPRMFNWSIDGSKIFFRYLKKGMFRDVGNQYKFKNLSFTMDELDALRIEEIVRVKEMFSRLGRNEVESHANIVCDNVQQSASAKNKPTVDKFEKEFLLEAVHGESTVVNNASDKNPLGYDFSANPPMVGEISVYRVNIECVHHSMIPPATSSPPHKTPTLDDFEFPDIRESQILVIENKVPYVTPTQRARIKVPGKALQSPYTDLSDSVGTGPKAPILFEMKHPFVQSTTFDVDQSLVHSFQLWMKQRLSKKRGRKRSAFTIASNKICPPFDFGVDRVDLMDWFYDLVTTGRPWGDS